MCRPSIEVVSRDTWILSLSLTSSRIGPEKGVIHIAFGAVDNALWDMFARSRRKPLWKLVVDMSPVSPPPKLSNAS